MEIQRDEATGSKRVIYDDAEITLAGFKVINKDMMGYPRQFLLRVTITAQWEFKGEDFSVSRTFDITELLTGDYNKNRNYRNAVLSRLRGAKVTLISCKQAGQERATWLYDEEQMRELLNS